VKHDTPHSDFLLRLRGIGFEECGLVPRTLSPNYYVRCIERQLSLRRLAVLLAIAAEGDNRD
jgi:hypothetical protein